MHEWPRPVQAAGRIDADVVTLACERDRVLLYRMIESFVSQVGEPAEILLVSDGSLTRDTTELLTGLSPSVRVTSFPGFIQEHPPPALVEQYAQIDLWGVKLAVEMRPPSGRPLIYTDSDVLFLGGGARLREYLAGDRPRYMRQEVDAYDERLTDGSDVLPGVNAGFYICPREIDWTEPVERLARVIDEPTIFTEQTVLALALTAAGAEPLPPDEFVLSYDDLKWPWDRYRRRDIVVRHYASHEIRWKLWLHGGPAGLRTLPRACLQALLGR